MTKTNNISTQINSKDCIAICTHQPNLSQIAKLVHQLPTAAILVSMQPIHTNSLKFINPDFTHTTVSLPIDLLRMAGGLTNKITLFTGNLNDDQFQPIDPQMLSHIQSLADLHNAPIFLIIASHSEQIPAFINKILLLSDQNNQTQVDAKKWAEKYPAKKILFLSP